MLGALMKNFEDIYFHECRNLNDWESDREKRGDWSRKSRSFLFIDYYFCALGLFSWILNSSFFNLNSQMRWRKIGGRRWSWMSYKKDKSSRNVVKWVKIREYSWSKKKKKLWASEIFYGILALILLALRWIYSTCKIYSIVHRSINNF